MLRPGKTLNSVHMLTLRNPVVLVGGILYVDFFFWVGPVVELPAPLVGGSFSRSCIFTCFTAFP